MADHDVLLQQQRQRYALGLQQQQQQQQQSHPHHYQQQQQSNKVSLEQAHELNEVLVGKRKRGTVGGGGRGGEGVGGGENVLLRGLETTTTSVESGRLLKRRNGAEVLVGGGGGAGGSGSQGGGGGGDGGVGSQIRKRKSLDKLGASSSEQDVVSRSPSDRSGKKRRAGGGGGDESNGFDPAEASDEGTAAQGPALRIRFTRRGNAFAVTKKGPVDGSPVDGVQYGDEDDGGIDGETEEVHGVGEGYRHRGSSDMGPSKRTRAEGEPSSSDGPTDQAKVAADGTANSLPNRNPESRQPLTREIYRIPSHAGWFSWMKIHNIERRALSEFFEGKSISKTPKIYKDYRDFIINKYRENMQRTLTFTEVRRMLIGDVNALRRVFDFLDHWGLINHQVVQEGNDQTPAAVSPAMKTVVEPIPSGLRMFAGPVVIPAGAPARPSQTDSFTGTSSAVSGLQPETFSSYKNVFTPGMKDAGASNAEPSGSAAPTYSCNSCGGDCTKLLFRCRKELQANYNLCADCFKNGKYGPGMIARDFTRIESQAGTLGDQWTTKETLSLLEAIMRYGDNWNQVAEHVGSKSRSDCVERFIQLPFGDRFLSDAAGLQPVSKVGENTTVTSAGGTDPLADVHAGDVSVASVAPEPVITEGNDTSATSQSTGTDAMGKPSPFEDASNPLLAQVAFMAAMVGPRVASAAAEAAIMAIAEEEPAVANLPLMNGHTLQGSVLKEGVTIGRQNSESVKESSRPETRHHGALSHLEGEKDKDGIPSVALVKASIGTALGAAAVNAKLLADQEERKMEYLMSDIIDNQLKRLHAKVEHFEELEMLVEKERVQLEQARQLLYAHHIQFAESRFYLNRERQG